MKYVVIAILVISVLGLAYWLNGTQSKGQSVAGSGDAGMLAQALDPRNMTISTASESDARAARLLPTKGSEDVSHLLVRPKPPVRQDEGGPSEAIDWVIDITTTQPRTFKRDQILGVFSREWAKDSYKEGFVNIYGRGAADKKWTDARTADVPEDYDQLAIAVELGSGTGQPATEAELNRFARTVEVSAKQLGSVVTRPRAPAKTAVSRSRELESLRKELGEARSYVLLAAPEGKTFDGKAVWDVMLCLGLHWGDMDEFHWENDERLIGDEHLFSVSSSTEPGYFLPEQIAAGRLHVGNLLFDFVIPRSADPAVVLQGMLAAATYARKRLGGELFDGEGAGLKPDALRKQVADITARMTKAGLPPGHEATVRFF